MIEGKKENENIEPMERWVSDLIQFKSLKRFRYK